MSTKSSRRRAYDSAITPGDHHHTDPPDPDALDELARQAASGDRAAMEELLATWYPSAFVIGRRVLRNEDDALDAAQNALISVARRIGSFDGRSRFSTWAYRIAVNASLDELRRRGRRPVVALAFTPDSVHHAALDRPSPAEPVDDSVTEHMAIDAALARLAPEQREVLLLRHRLDLDYEEMAAVLRVPVGTVRSRISRARAALRPLLAEGPGNFPAVPGRPSRRDSP